MGQARCPTSLPLWGPQLPNEEADHMKKLSPSDQERLYGRCEWCEQPRIIAVEVEDLGDGNVRIVDTNLACTVCKQEASLESTDAWYQTTGLP
jgi:hypothetical protein